MENQWFNAVTVKPVRLYDGSNEGGAVTLFFDCDLEGTNQPVSATITLVQKDGTLREKAFRAAAEILKCDPANFDWAKVDGTDETTVGLEVSVIQNDKFWNCYPRGESKPACDPREMQSKYGAKLRALFGGTAPAPRTTANNFQAGAPKTQPKTIPTAPPPPLPPADLPMQTCTMQDAWQTFVETYQEQNGAKTELNKKWFECILGLAGKKQADCQPEDWFRVKTAAAGWVLENVIPF
jgi:hypothetical protein